MLAWFPKAFRWVNGRINSLRESGGLIKQYNVAYYMISVDNLEDNTRFAKNTTPIINSQ